MSARPWNHNIHYHDLVLRSAPGLCRRVLDVGCGAGLLARRLAEQYEEIVTIDADHGVISRAQTASTANARIRFVEGDVMTHPFPNGSFDFIAAVAVLHHLPLGLALTRFQNLLRPGGVLAVVRLYRAHTLEDYAWSAAAFPASWMLRCVRRRVEVAAPVQEPKETLHEIRSVCDRLLPGAVFRRRLLFRYSITWRKPFNGCVEGPQPSQ
jgi:2-polyprenyl-3-methyl-5-hydroxy-6-metoxy-1,4-benzoquinol methylase